MLTKENLLKEIQKPKKSKELCEIFNVTDIELRVFIRDLVNQGELICSSVNGFFIPKSEEDFKEGYYNLVKRINPIAKRANRLKTEFYKRFNSELTLFQMEV